MTGHPGTTTETPPDWATILNTPPPPGLDAAAVTLFQSAQRKHLDELRTACADRPDHAEYLRTLTEVGAENMADPQFWPGVSRPVADALTDDVAWCVQNVTTGQGFPSGFPGRYQALRARNARAAARRAATIEHDQQWAWTNLTTPDTTTRENR